jgi:hypothetical protein
MSTCAFSHQKNLIWVSVIIFFITNVVGHPSWKFRMGRYGVQRGENKEQGEEGEEDEEGEEGERARRLRRARKARGARRASRSRRSRRARRVREQEAYMTAFATSWA